MTLDNIKEEIENYVTGILIDVDNIVIDGNGHTIDAKGKTRIFYICYFNSFSSSTDCSHGSSALKITSPVRVSASCAPLMR